IGHRARAECPGLVCLELYPWELGGLRNENNCRNYRSWTGGGDCGLSPVQEKNRSPFVLDLSHKQRRDFPPRHIHELPFLYWPPSLFLQIESGGRSVDRDFTERHAPATALFQNLLRRQIFHLSAETIRSVD